MYLVAQRVRSRGNALIGAGSTGINVVFYRHGDALPRTPAGEPDVRRISEQEPGTLVSTASDVPSGGNDVLSYLDVAAPDDISVEVLQHQLGMVEDEVAAASLPRTWSPAIDIAIAFFVHGIEGERARLEFGALKSRLLAHLRTTLSPAQHGKPFVAQLIRERDAVVLRWTPEAQERLLQLKFSGGRSVRISYDVADEWASSDPPGPLIAHALAAIAGADLHDLVIRGGVRVVDGDRMVWERLSG